MAGEDLLDGAVALVSRLLDRPVAADEVIALRSVQRAALAAWAKKVGAPIKGGVLENSHPFRLSSLMGAGDGPPASEPAAPRRAAAGTGAPPAGGVGLDLEQIEALPQADDYREHAFYRDNFTPAEIAYCIRQPNVRASFCGLWAAKEAVLKSGAAVAQGTTLAHIEIGRDEAGRPTHPGCALSISHTPQTAAAVCLLGAAAPAPPPPAGPNLTFSKFVPAKHRARRAIAAGLAGIAAIAALATLAAFLHI